MLVASGRAPSTFLCSSCFLYLRTFAPVPTPLSDRLALFLLSSLSAQLLANFDQHDVGYADVATGRRGFSLPTLELPTISQHRLLRCRVSFISSEALQSVRS